MQCIVVVLVPNNPMVIEGEPPVQYCVEMPVTSAVELTLEVNIAADSKILKHKDTHS